MIGLPHVEPHPAKTKTLVPSLGIRFDVCYKQAFYGIPGYHVWYLSDGQFTEGDYDPDAQHKKWARIIDKCLEALERAEVAINVSQPWLRPTSTTTRQANHTFTFSHDALSSLREITFANEDTADIAKSVLLCVSNTLTTVQNKVTESLASCSDAPAPLVSDKKAFSSVQKSLFTGVRSLSDKSFQFKAAPKMHSVGFYVHNSILTTSWRVKTCKGANRELLATLEIATATEPLAIHNVYNHVNRLNVDRLLSYLDSYAGHSILLGDFSYHQKDWNGGRKTETSTSSNKFAEGVKARNYILKTKEGAITYSNSSDETKRSSTIDLTFAKGSVSESVGYCEVLQAPGFLSDHRVIEASIKRTVKTDVKTMSSWDNITPAKFQHHLKPRLPPLDSPLDNEDQVVDFFGKIIDALHRVKQLVSKLRKRLAELDALKKKDQTPKSIRRVSFLECDLDRLITEMWDASDREKTRRPSTRELFNVFRLARGISQPLQFAQTLTLKYKDDGGTARPQRGDISMSRDTNAEKLRTIIKNLKNNKAPGPDKVPNEAIKLGMELLLPYVVLGFRACLNLSLHPANFRDSIIVMVLKAGKEPDKPESYRPISLLSTVGKLYEKILADMMTGALKENSHLLPATQFGNKTTTEALQYHFRIIFSAWCSSSDDVVTILGLDMSSAYDNVFRQRLLQTLYDKGFPRWFVGIIGLVLSLRDATIRLPGIISEPFEMKTGIPQGSPLSTVLFYFFVYPLVERTFPPRRIYVDGKKETVRLYQFFFVDDVYYVAVSRSYAINCRGLKILHELMMPIAKELPIAFGAHKYHVMHMRLPTVREPTRNQVRPKIEGFVEKVQEKMTILAWFIKQSEGVTTHLHFGLRKKMIGRLQSLQSECLRFFSGAFGCVAGTLVEKELFIENIDGSSKARIQNPIKILDDEAGKVLEGALDYQILVSQESDDLSYAWTIADRFANRKEWGKIVGSHIKWTGSPRLSGPMAELRLPVALREQWGKQSLRYYKGLTRAQSTMLFQCRTEFIVSYLSNAATRLLRSSCGTLSAFSRVVVFKTFVAQR
ncbi:hypothetical protein FANTH_2640 [Fusarium anthophilum]|uniref:Reverse transcriptase domain-containing protein n=1 Tax=Fusarium anthophilum TaxID=48485 RepID=A0A8H4ZTW1_9HYPO|nr:hypothetical protein FANTH_2640 [Fusarium anthophilum]